MKLKVFCRTFIVLMLVTVNIFLFTKYKNKQNILSNNSVTKEEEKKTDEKKKEQKNPEEKRKENIKKYLEDKNISTVGLSAFNPNLEKFVTQFLKRKYNYRSLADDRKLEDFYSDELKKEYLEKTKGKKPHPKYDEKSSLRENMSININTIDEKTFIVTTIHERDVFFINRVSNQQIRQDKTGVYTNTFIIVIDKDRYKIQKEEEMIIKDIRNGA